MSVAHGLSVRLRRLSAPASDVAQAHACMLIRTHRIHTICWCRLISWILRLLLLNRNRRSVSRWMSSVSGRWSHPVGYMRCSRIVSVISVSIGFNICQRPVIEKVYKMLSNSLKCLKRSHLPLSSMIHVLCISIHLEILKERFASSILC